jgi:uncharacterized protein YxjI
MRYVLKQKLWSFGDDYIIRDADGNDCYFVDGRALSIKHKLSFQDMHGRELAFIRQRWFSWGPAYEIYRNDQLLAVVKKHLFTLFRCKFGVDGPGANDFEAVGNFIDHEYEINHAIGTVARVSKRWFSFTDTYGIEIADGQDQVLLLAAAVVIDLVCHDEHDKE